jgi:hypothetical protein
MHLKRRQEATVGNDFNCCLQQVLHQATPEIPGDFVGLRMGNADGRDPPLVKTMKKNGGGSHKQHGRSK